METHTVIAGQFAGVAVAGFLHREVVQLWATEVAGSGRGSGGPIGRVAEVESLRGVVREADGDELEGVVDRVVALEVQETCRVAHRAHGGHDRHSLAGLVEGAGGAGFDGEVGLLGADEGSGFLGIGVVVVVLADGEEVGLPGRASILAPQPLQVDRADIAPSRESSEGSVDLLEVVVGPHRVGLVAADVLPDVFLAGLHRVVDGEGVSVEGRGHAVLGDGVGAFGVGEGDEEGEKEEELELHDRMMKIKVAESGSGRI